MRLFLILLFTCFYFYSRPEHPNELKQENTQRFAPEPEQAGKAAQENCYPDQEDQVIDPSSWISCYGLAARESFAVHHTGSNQH